MTEEGGTLKARLEAIVEEMVARGILFEDARAEFERHFVRTVLERHNGNMSRAAEELRIHRNTLAKRVEAMKPKRARKKK
jgi:transcriptional regulator with PAS, ATPase and Fis domain